MNVYPTRASGDLAVAGMVVVAAGLVFEQASVLAWGGALLVGLVVARAVTQLGISRVRTAGFEMLWRSEGRVRRVARGDIIELEAEVRNRDTRAARYERLRAVASPELVIEVEPSAGEVPAAGRLRVTLRISTRRVGRQGIHGLSLEVQGSPGLFEVPLTFANPFGIEVLPRPFSILQRSARGGRSRMSSDEGPAGPLAGQGAELRELREHQPGDPFKRIAWRASARRGQLLVREYEREERDVVWIVLDASIELWAGEAGMAPLDHAIDEAAAVVIRHMARGDRVGLGVLSRRVLAWLPPERGPTHAVALLGALSHAAACLDADRSDLDEADVALRVLEHLRPLDPSSAQRVRPSDLDRIARRADRLVDRAPFAPTEPWATSRRERALRRYLAAFGVGSPARLEPDRPFTDAVIAETLGRLARERPRASIVYVWSPAPDTAARQGIERAIRKLPRRRVELRWVTMALDQGLSLEGGRLTAVVGSAISMRARAAQQRGEQALRGVGVRIERVQSRHQPSRPAA